ncbi:hypothetical protein LSUE1_G000882 [Lachnellula suecica]|uniref:Rhodopsin domain-containing protein n=1 Tax=Lachnellula suecica TaxID=602035 RepID=A0A8T9CF03_9HELO|nr:hypothetical protein LSUE1_G000882 [Lachnellula suecica]
MSSTLPSADLPYFTGGKVDNSSAQGSIVRVSITILILILLTGGLRFWVRLRMLRSSGLNDIFLAVGLIFAILLCASALIGEHFGLGKHLWNLNLMVANLRPIIKSLYGCFLAYSTAICFTKLSLVASYFRIFSPGIHRKILIGLGVMICCLWVASIFAIVFACAPVGWAWNLQLGTKHKCYPIVDFFYAFSAINIVHDVLLFLLPIPTLWALRLSKFQRVVLCILFSKGSFACIASVVRLSQLHYLTKGIDFSYSGAGVLNWSVIEVGTAIICASISALHPLATEYLPKLLPCFVFGDVQEIPHTPEPPKHSSRSSYPHTRHSPTNSCSSEMAINPEINPWQSVEHLSVPVAARLALNSHPVRSPVHTSFLLDRTSTDTFEGVGDIIIASPTFDIREWRNSGRAQASPTFDMQRNSSRVQAGPRAESICGNFV